MNQEPPLIQENEFQVIKSIGRGSYAVVLLVKRINSSEELALKKFHSNFTNSRLREMFEREVEVMNRCDHPCILKMKGYFIPEKDSSLVPLILTEYMPNKDLNTIFEQSPDKITPTRKMIIAFGVAEGMRYFHSLGGLHRDLKPANIMLDANFKPKIADFGLSKISEDASQSMIAGSPFWMAPELFEHNQYNESIDVYAYAVVLFQLLTGIIPFGGKISTFELGRRVLNGERPAIPNSIPVEFSDMINRCWDQDPSNRPTFSQIVDWFNDLNVCIEGTNMKKYNEYRKKLGYGTKTNKPYKDDFQMGIDLLNSGRVYDAASAFYASSQTGNINAMYHLGKLLIHSQEVQNNPLQGSIYMKYAADNGNPDAQYECGVLLFEGKHVQANKPLAIEYFLLSAKQRNPYAMEFLAKMYYSGEGVPQDLEKSKGLFEKAIEYGSSTAESEMKKLFCVSNFEETTSFVSEYGQPKFASFDFDQGPDTVPTNDVFDSFSQQPANKQPNSTNNIFDFAPQPNTRNDSEYQNGLKLITSDNRQNVTNGILILKKLALSNNVDALFKCGMLLFDGTMVKRDPLKASVFLYKAAFAGHPEAQLLCGKLLLEGKFVKPDNRKAAYLFKLSADQGNTEALFSFGKCLEAGIGVPKSDTGANVFYKEAADLDHPEAQMIYAYRLDNGIGFNGKRYAEALNYYLRAADKQIADAICNIGNIYENGKGVAKDLFKATEYYRSAALAGSTIAMYNYALMLQTGSGIDVNILESSKFYKMAADRGYNEAIINYVNLLMTSLKGDPKSKSEAIKYSKISADLNDKRGQYMYGYLLYEQKPPKPEAIEYIRKSARQGYQRAIDYLQKRGL